MSALPRITFGMIVLNGEPFLPYNLRALYPFAHQIIVVEGAAPGAAAIATPDGHSRDGTLHSLRRFREREDPEGKVVVVTAEDEGHPDGFWPGEKDEQSRAYAARATGEYLWQVDVDEFYMPDDMTSVVNRLERDPAITAVSFRMITFWGGFDYVTDGWYLRRGAAQYHRLFRWGPGYRYATHRPPTVLDPGGRDLREIRWLDGDSLSRQGILLYHYSLLFPQQVEEKCEYYASAEWAHAREARRWADESYGRLRRPYRVHNVYRFPSWLERHRGGHPPQVEALRGDIGTGRVAVELRQVGDVERILRSPLYRAGRVLVKYADYLHRLADDTQPLPEVAAWLPFRLPIRVLRKAARLYRDARSGRGRPAKGTL